MISPKIVRVVSETILETSWQFDTVYTAKLTGQADEDWIMAFARSGGNVIISADQKMLKRDTLVRRISDTGLIGVYLPSFYAGLKRDEQLAYFVHWWKKIEEQITKASSGSVWLVPKGLGGGDIRQHKVTPEPRRRQLRS